MPQQHSIYEQGLERQAANFAPLSPLNFLRRSAFVHPERTAVVHGQARYSYAEFYARVRRLASALAKRGIGRGKTVAVMAPNVPALLEAHYGVPLAGGILNAINTRLDPASIAFILNHGQADILIADKELSPAVKPALAQLGRAITVIDIDDPLAEAGALLGEKDYEALLEEGDPAFEAAEPGNEWQSICLLYTSGTTGNPKGVLYSHRGAALNAMGNCMTFGLTGASRYLWTLPMFHCSGWTFTWAVTSAAATHVCLRKVEAGPIFRLLEEERVTHLCGAPIVINMLATADDSIKRPLAGPVRVMTGGAAPPSAIIKAMEEQGFSVLHAYGLTEVYGPATACDRQEAWDDYDLPRRAAMMARQGVRYTTLDGATVKDAGTMAETPWDGETIGEIMLRGNTVMKGYLKNPQATEEAFAGGWFHTGDLAVRHPDGYIEVKDRSKDIIVSGGENISSLEVEEALYRHPGVLEAAVVARPDERWGETPCAFVTLRPGAEVGAAEIIDHCRGTIARYKVPKTVVFGALPKTSTGKIQKFALRQQAKDL
ncbi:MAG: acyl-CoA synthetase [Rhodospirillales bacterium]|nr:acyl-CoA synthetase [Rhodospirillales bacterium]